MFPAIERIEMRNDRKGNAAVEYMLVVAVLVLGLAAAFYRPQSNDRNVPRAFSNWYHDLTERISKP